MTTLEEILDGKIITILRGLDKETTLKTADGAVALANIFCWAAALLYAQMASKSVTFSMPFFINAVHSQASLSACLISGCFVFNYQNLCLF